MSGDITGKGYVDISDALEILKLLAGLPTVITVPVGASNAPSIDDVLEVLKLLAGLPNNIGAIQADGK
jgi:hypothetical protein